MKVVHFNKKQIQLNTFPHTHQHTNMEIHIAGNFPTHRQINLWPNAQKFAAIPRHIGMRLEFLSIFSIFPFLRKDYRK